MIAASSHIILDHNVVDLRTMSSQGLDRGCTVENGNS
jgi:hypothetical protein